eukprot:Hpha_TRINITY_DN15392_c3_g5::TRINITY_DN15392_c3_g5_i2::g.90556::m.90556
MLGLVGLRFNWVKLQGLTGVAGSFERAKPSSVTTTVLAAAARALDRLHSTAEVAVTAHNRALLRQRVALERLVRLEEHEVQQQHRCHHRRLLVRRQRRVPELQREQVSVGQQLLHRLSHGLRLLLRDLTQVPAGPGLPRHGEVLVKAHLRHSSEAAQRALNRRERRAVRAPLEHLHRRPANTTADRLLHRPHQRRRVLDNALRLVLVAELLSRRHPRRHHVQRGLSLTARTPHRARPTAPERPVHEHHLSVRTGAVVVDVHLQGVVRVAAAPPEKARLLIRHEDLLPVLRVDLVLVLLLAACLRARDHPAQRVARHLRLRQQLLDRQLTVGAHQCRHRLDVTSVQRRRHFIGLLLPL